MKVAATIQARLGSSRLPRKALLNLNGLPLIDHVIKQVKSASRVDSVILSTSDTELDQQLISHFKEKNLLASTGPVDNIISRLYSALETANAGVLVRVWGDCPFVCGDITDAMLEFFERNHLDFLSNSDISNRTFPPGVDIEIYSRPLLVFLNSNVTDIAQREFPIESVKKLTSEFKFNYFHLQDFSGAVPGFKSSDLHLTIDYPDDLKAAEIILKKLAPNNGPFSFSDLSRFITANPELFNLFSKEQRNIEYKKYLTQKEKET